MSHGAPTPSARPTEQRTCGSRPLANRRGVTMTTGPTRHRRSRRRGRSAPLPREHGWLCAASVRRRSSVRVRHEARDLDPVAVAASAFWLSTRRWRVRLPSGSRRAHGAVGGAPASHAGGGRFDSDWVHSVSGVRSPGATGRGSTSGIRGPSTVAAWSAPRRNVAQQGARVLREHEVAGSSPAIPTQPVRGRR